MNYKKLMKLNFDNKIIYQFDNVFTNKECNDIINYCELLGFTDLQTNKHGEQFYDPDFRNDKCCILGDVKMLEILTKKIKVLFPGDYKLNSIIRASKYEENSYCKPHEDDIINNGSSLNKYTILLYLNDSVGGETVFHFNDKKLQIKPKTGSIIIFDRSIIHESLVCQKIKYTLRTDLLFIDQNTNTNTSIRKKGRD